MTAELKQQFELFVKNTQAIRSKFSLESDSMKTMGALFYTLQNKNMDVEAIKQCQKLIKENAGMFSVIRGNLFVVFASKLSLSENPEKQLSNTMLVYDLMKKAKFSSSDYLIYSAYLIAEQAQEENYSVVIERAKAIYDGMKKKHWFITSEDDYIYATSVALSDKPIDDTLANIEDIFTELKPPKLSSNEFQGLAQTLALSPNGIELIQKVDELKQAFRDVKLKLDSSQTLSTLGILAMIPIDLNELVDSITEGYNLLRNEKGFGMWSLDKTEVLIFTVAIAASNYVKNDTNSISVVSTSLLNILIAQQIMMLIIIMSVTTASSSSH